MQRVFLSSFQAKSIPIFLVLQAISLCTTNFAVCVCNSLVSLSKTMALPSLQFQFHQTPRWIFLTLVLSLVLFGFGQAQDYGDYEDHDASQSEAPISPPTTEITKTTPAVSPEQEALESRIVKKVMAELNSVLQERDLALNRTLEDLKRQIQRIRNSIQSPPPSGGGDSTATGLFAKPSVSQTNAEMIRKLQDQVLLLKSKTLNSQSYNETAESILELSATFQKELQDQGYKTETLIKDLRNQNIENVQLYFGRLANITAAFQEYQDDKREATRGKKVEELLESFKNDPDVKVGVKVRVLLDDLSQLNLLDASMPEIVQRMFNGNIRNYPKIISLFQSANRHQYRSGLAALIDLFHEPGSGAPRGGNSNSNSNLHFNSNSSGSLLSEPEYLKLAYLSKKDFELEFQTKFPRLVQNLVFKDKVCIRDLRSNLYLFVDRDEDVKEGGYSVSTRSKSAAAATPTSIGFCDWEIVPGNLGEGQVFIIRQRQRESDGGEGPWNLNVVGREVFAGTIDYNPFHFWKIQLRGNAQKLTLQNVPGSSDGPSLFLCSKRSGTGKGRRGLEVSPWAEGTFCDWFID